MKLLLPFYLYLLLLAVCQGKYFWEDEYPFIKDATSFSSSSFSTSSNGGGNGYDYIIVGGGTVGCPLATTLSQNMSVLLLERGGVPFGNSNISFLQNFHISLLDNSPSSAAQFFMSSDGVYNSRARVLGGGTCINAGFYTRASLRDISRLGMDPKLVNESYPWIEKQIVHMPQLADWQKAVKDGLLDAGISPDNGFTYDHLYGTKVGGTIFDKYGRRHTAAELLRTANPNNLDVLIHATVHKIVFDHQTTGKKPRAVGVIFKDKNGKQHQAFLSKRRKSEIIVSCGAIGSPQLLLLSGIGPKRDLKKMNISVVLDNKFVGKGMSDNPMNALYVPFNKPVEQTLIQTVGITKLGVYIEASSGFSESPDSIHWNHGLVSAEIGQLSTIPPKQRTEEAIEAYRRRKQNLPREVFNAGFILEKLGFPKSKGKLSLSNTNVDDNPNVSFNYFRHPQDVRKCVEGIRVVEKLVTSKHVTSYMPSNTDSFSKLLNLSVQANLNFIPKNTNDTKSLEQFCKDTVITIWHYHGGCQVGKVVSHNYQVLGLHRLRVIDGSTLLHSPGTNPQATMLMMGRYMGLKILRQRLGRAAGF